MSTDRTIDLGVINVITGSYTNSAGEKKPSGDNIGHLFKTGDRYWIKLDKTVFHAALYARVERYCRDKEESMVACSVFPPRDSDAPKKPASSQPAGDDDSPF
jgi:hypothetical protein